MVNIRDGVLQDKMDKKITLILFVLIPLFIAGCGYKLVKEESNNQNVNITNNLDDKYIGCPDFLKVDKYEGFYGYVGYQSESSTKAYPQLSGSPYFKAKDGNSINCYSCIYGYKEGHNINYLYCTKDYASTCGYQNQHIDSEGNIQPKVSYSLEIISDGIKCSQEVVEGKIIYKCDVVSMKCSKY